MKQGWEVKKLGDVCEELFAGGDVSKDNLSKVESNIFCIPIFTNGEKNKGLYGYTNIARVTKPSITISARGTIGYSEIRKEPFYPAIRLIVVTPDISILNLSFLKYQIGSIDFTHSGTSIPQLTVPMIREYLIHFPSLPEQQRIVTILDEAFGAINQAKENAEQNLKNAQELFESYLQSVFETKGEDWEEKKWKDVLEIRSGRNQAEVEDADGKYPILGSAGKIMGFANKYLCEECTTIIGRKGTINNPMFIEYKFWNVDTAFGLHASDILDKKFLFYFCKNFDFTTQDKGSGRPSLVKSDLLQLDISFPPLAEQQSIIAKLDALSEQTKKLERIYEQKLADLEELKKSILHKAFNGEL